MLKIKYVLRSLIKSVLTPITNDYIYIIKYGGIEVTVKGGLEFLSVSHHSTPEERFLSNLHLQGKTIYDLGSHIGILTIFFAKSSGKTGKVICF